LIELARDLRLKPVYVLGHLHALWHNALEQQEDGDLSSWSDDLIAEMSGYESDAPRYVFLLQQHGWLNNKVLHDWLDYAGKYLTAKYRTANPKRLRQILMKHKSVNSRFKIGRSPIGLGRLGQVGKNQKGESEGETILLPLDPAAWDRFKEHRRKMGKPLGRYAEKRMMIKLNRLVGEGSDPVEVIQQSIDEAWQGLFPLRHNRVERQKQKITHQLNRNLE